jgi:putative ABC transport system permease protein
VADFFDRWREILEVMWRRKLRTALTALSVAWGIFMLVLLLAAGEGLSNGARAEFQRNAQSSVYLFPGRMSKPHGGNPIGKAVQLRNDDKELTHRVLPNIDRASARADLGRQVVRHGQRASAFTVKGCLPDNAAIENTVILSGRFISAIDQDERRKVAAIGTKVRQTFFAADEDPIGQSIEIGRVVLTVIGVFEEQEEQAEQETIYLPLSTTQLVWGRRDRLDRILFTLADQAPASLSRTQDNEPPPALAPLQNALASRHGFARDDKQAVFLWSSDENYLRFVGLLRGIRTFVWLIGLGTILAGVVGVSNIMLISVRERTREIGVRKAIGAPPSAIIAMIVQEALTITLVSGYFGLVAAVAAVSAARSFLPPTPYFRQPDVDLGVGLAATAVLAVAGTLAGLFPAREAARINPIRALRVE